MKVINLGATDSIINSYMAQLRDVEIQKNRSLFRQNLTRIAHAMAYEVSHTMQYAPKTVRTPLAEAVVRVPQERVVIGTVLRAGLAFQQGFSDVFDTADSAFIAAFREEGDKNNLSFHFGYMAAPKLDGCTLLLVDPMLATGGSLKLAYKNLLKNGIPAKLHICVVIASEKGIRNLQEAFPFDDVTLWTAAIDSEMNEQSYIVPGLGDAGDLSFGPKL